MARDIQVVVRLNQREADRLDALTDGEEVTRAAWFRRLLWEEHRRAIRKEEAKMAREMAGGLMGPVSQAPEAS